MYGARQKSKMLEPIPVNNPPLCPEVMNKMYGNCCKLKTYFFSKSMGKMYN